MKFVAAGVSKYIAPLAFVALTSNGWRGSDKNVGRWMTGM